MAAVLAKNAARSAPTRQADRPAAFAGLGRIIVPLFLSAWFAGRGCTRRVRSDATKACRRAAADEKGEGGKAAFGSAILAGVCLFTTVLNRMCFRFALVPLGHLTHFLSITTNAIYVAFFSVARRRMTQSSPELLSKSWSFLMGEGRWYVAGAGIAECVAFTSTPLFARNLPGSIVTVLSQSMLVFSMLFSRIVFSRRYDKLQYLGVSAVVLGIAVCSYPAHLADVALGRSGGMASMPFFYNALGLCVSYSCFAFSFVFKEKAFIDFAGRDPARGPLDGNSVNLTAALWQSICLWLLWPFNFRYITSMAPKAYFAAASGVLQNPSSAAILLLYWVANVCYLVTSVETVSRLSSVVALLIGALGVPLTALLFCLPWPVLGAERFSWYSVAGVLVISGGVLLYNHRKLRR